MEVIDIVGKKSKDYYGESKVHKYVILEKQ